MIRALVIAFALLACAACGKYGPPVRSATEPATTAPAAVNTEECPDPNAPAPAAATTP